MDALTGQRSGFPAHQLELTLRLGQLSGTQVQLNQIAVCDHELREKHQRAAFPPLKLLFNDRLVSTS